MRIVLFLVVTLLFPCLLVAQSWPVKAGHSYGPIQLGQALDQAQQSLGQPTQRKTSAGDPSSQLLTYSKSVMLLVNQDKKVLGITLWAPGARTAEGVGMGSSQQEVQSKLGKGLQRGSGQVLYNESGIGFSYSESGKVDTIFLFRPEAQLALHGDRIIVAGQRSGDIKLGMTLAQVEKAWGKAPNQSGKDHRWPDRGVGLLVDGGRVQAITLTTGDYITQKGLKVGSTRQDVLSVLGAPSTQGGGEGVMLYPSRGIAFYLAGNLVGTVQIFAPMK